MRKINDNPSSKNVLLIIMDGYGLAEKNEFNAISNAVTPNLDAVFEKFPVTKLKASGVSVGLPEGQVGNSEVGHTNIGAGRVIYQDLTFINKSIQTGEFYSNNIINDVINDTEKTGGALHIAGLISAGGVHSHIQHLYAILELLKTRKLNKIFVHAWTDGRDAGPKTASKHLSKIETALRHLNKGEIATICGRYYAMDRDNNLDRTQIAAEAILEAKGRNFRDFSEAINQLYSEGLTDEFLTACILGGYQGIKPEDSLICFNYRPDRARQIIRALSEKVKNCVCFTQYDRKIKNTKIAFQPREIKNTLGEHLASLGMTQLRIAETEKYAHVTFFFNSGREEPYPGEERIIVNSPKVKTYDLKPEMSTKEITRIVKDKIKSKKYDLIVLNFSNPDMVGHTGNLKATIKAVETVDECVGQLLEEIRKIGGVTVLTADHGNAEKMRDERGFPHTSHTCNLVPFSVIGYDCTLKSSGALCDIAPTICEILGIKKPDEMSGVSLIK